MDGGLSFAPWYSFTNKNQEWVTIYEANTLKDEINDKHFKKSTAIDPKKKEKLKQFIKELSIEDNPVVVIVKMK